MHLFWIVSDFVWKKNAVFFHKLYSFPGPGQIDPRGTHLLLFFSHPLKLIEKSSGFTVIVRTAGP